MKILNSALLASLALASLVATSHPVFARGHSGGGRSSSRSYSSRSSRSSYSSGSTNPGHHYTSGYTTRRGTSVKGYNSTNSDNHFGNNYSTKGNRNPFTGKMGTRVTPRNGERQ